MHAQVRHGLGMTSTIHFERPIWYSGACILEAYNGTVMAVQKACIVGPRRWSNMVNGENLYAKQTATGALPTLQTTDPNPNHF
jgi:hypothetical protein